MAGPGRLLQRSLAAGGGGTQGLFSEWRSLHRGLSADGGRGAGCARRRLGGVPGMCGRQRARCRTRRGGDRVAGEAAPATAARGRRPAHAQAYLAGGGAVRLLFPAQVVGRPHGDGAERRRLCDAAGMRAAVAGQGYAAAGRRQRRSRGGERAPGVWRSVHRIRCVLAAERCGDRAGARGHHGGVGIARTGRVGYG
eukprot:ctg_5841.g766